MFSVVGVPTARGSRNDWSNGLVIIEGLFPLKRSVVDRWWAGRVPDRRFLVDRDPPENNPGRDLMEPISDVDDLERILCDVRLPPASAMTP